MQCHAVQIPQRNCLTLISADVYQAKWRNMPEDLNLQQNPNRGLNFIKINRFRYKSVLNSRNRNVSVFHGDISVAKHKSRVRERLP